MCCPVEPISACKPDNDLLFNLLPIPTFAGLSSQTPEEQVESVMALCKELLDVAGSIISSDSGKLELTFGIHSAAAQVRDRAFAQTGASHAEHWAIQLAGC